MTGTVFGYDFDGVLAEGPAPNTKKWGLMNGAERAAHRAGLVAHYRIARPLLVPDGKHFHVITARKHNPDVAEASSQWLERHYPRRWTLHLLVGSRTYENVIAHKRKVIETFGIEDFTEDNPTIVRALRRFCPRVRVWLFGPQGQLTLT